MTMKRRDFALSALAPLLLSACGGSDSPTTNFPPGPKANAADALKRATQYMDDTVSYQGGYVWSYSPDLKQTFGEMEAYRTMCWIQPPGTPSVGHVYLDAYHATGDERHWRAAERTATAIMAAQHSSGGWNYIHDFAGEASLKKWYDTIGKNGWRLEEFQHYYGNATFDDAGTAVASQFLLRMYLEKREDRYLPAVQKAIDFVVNAQFGPEYGVANGGWPQRFPHFPGAISSMPPPNLSQLPAGAKAGMDDGDYTLHVTFNDDVMGENIKFLTLCMVSLGETRLLGNIQRAMECMRLMQYSGPQAGWGLQHLSREKDGRPAGSPAGARSYEPRSLATHTTQTNIRQMFNYFQLTGDRKYLARLPEAIAWLKSCPLPADAAAKNPLLGGGRTHPTFVELGTNEGLYVHRYGSNIHNGAYYVDKDYTNTVSHYSAGRPIDIAGLETTYNKLSSMSDTAVAELAARSPLKAASGTLRALPTYFSIREVDFPDLFSGAVMVTPVVPESEVATLLNELGSRNYWTSPVPEIVNPYQGDGPTTPYTGTAYRSKHVGDVYDTSPYPADNPPEVPPYVKKDKPQFIVTADWIRRMGRLIAFVAPVA